MSVLCGAAARLSRVSWRCHQSLVPYSKGPPAPKEYLSNVEGRPHIGGDVRAPGKLPIPLRAPHIALLEAGAPFTLSKVDLKKKKLG